MFQVERSFYDPQQDHGFWSPSTSSANFCEEDYQKSYYIAEFINTISNLAYVYYAFRPIIVRLPTSHQSKEHLKQAKTSSDSAPASLLKSPYDIHTFALLAIGVTSGLYHCTLHSFGQWLDESSMYILAAAFIHALLATTYVRTNPNSSTNVSLPRTVITRHNSQQIALTLTLVLASTSILSYLTGNLWVHTGIFALLIVLSGAKMIYLLFTYETPAQIERAGKRSFLGLVNVTETQRVMVISLLRSWMFLNLALAVWLIDCNPGWCAWLRWVRGEVLGAVPGGEVLGMLTELHGWWHVFTARAAGEYVGLVRLLTTVGTGR